MLSHDELLNDIDECDLESGTSAIWWLGQHSFIVKLADRVLYFDPFLSEHPSRLLPPLLDADEITHADLVFGSHDHTDHIDHPALKKIAQSSPNATFIFPESLGSRLSGKLGIDRERIIGLDDGYTIDIDGLTISAIPAAHEFLDYDAASEHYPYLGYIVEYENRTIYHSGDTCIYEGLLSRLKQWTFDLVFLPINGRDAKRLSTGCIGNMTYQEAADLAGTLTPGITIPGHYGMFKNNTIDPTLFADYMAVKYPDLKVHLCEPGTRIVV